MKYIFKSDNIQMTPSMEHLAKDKFSKIVARYSDYPEDSVSVKIVMNSDKEDKFLVRADLIVNGKEYFSDEKGFTLESALINVAEELLRMLAKEKEVKRGHQQHGDVTVVADELLESDELQ